MKLTDVQIKNLKPKDTSYKITDGGGLYLGVSKLGTKVWRVKFYFEKKQYAITLGEYPYISLKDARAKLCEIKTMILKGVNPYSTKNLEEEIMTFEKVAYAWLKKLLNIDFKGIFLEL